MDDPNLNSVYLLIGATFILLLTFIILITHYTSSTPFSPSIIHDLLFRNRGLRNIGNLNVKNYLAVSAFLSFLFQLTSMTLIAIIELNKSSSPFFPNIKNFLSSEVLFTLFVLSIIAEIIDLVIMFILLLIFLYDVQPVNRTPPAEEVTGWEQESRDFGSVRLTRFEDSEKTIIYANCRDDPSGKIFKFALCQAKGEGARTDCYLYDEEAQTLEKIIPTPVTVDELEKLFSDEHY